MPAIQKNQLIARAGCVKRWFIDFALENVLNRGRTCTMIDGARVVSKLDFEQ